jgi:hypothetical protein
VERCGSTQGGSMSEDDLTSEVPLSCDACAQCSRALHVLDWCVMFVAAMCVSIVVAAVLAH